MAPEVQSALTLAAKHLGIAERGRYRRCASQRGYLNWTFDKRLVSKHYRKAQKHLSRAAKYAQENP